MRKALPLFLCLFCLVKAVTAQEKTISGTVTNSVDGAPVPGATVLIKGTKTATITGSDGSYLIRTEGGQVTLVFSSVGYKSSQLSARPGAIANVMLTSESQQLTEVVVVGFDKKNRRDIAGAVGSVKAKDIENLPIPSFDRAIQGKIAGVQVVSTNGIPGGAVDVKIRGVGSISAGTAPLYIIDGIQINSGDQTRNTPSSNALAGINPDDIMSIDVLKDPASASIYGAQAANGVVIITTKRGRSGKSKITYNTYFGFSERIKKIDLLTAPEVAQLGYESYLFRDGLTAANNFVTSLGVTDLKNLPTYDWQSLVFQQGFIQNHELSLSGGNDKTTFFVSGSYNTTKGHVINTTFGRKTFRLNLDHKVDDRLSLSTSLNLSDFTQRGVSGAGAFANPNRSALLMWPSNKPFNDDGTINFADGPTTYFGSYNHNVLKTALLNYQKADNKKMQGRMALSYQLSPAFALKTSFNLDYTDIKEDAFTDPRTIDGAGVNGRVSYFATEIRDIQTDQTLTFKKVFNERHNVSALGGFQYRYYKRTGRNASGTGIPIYLLSSLNATSTPVSAGSLFNDWKIAGIFAKVDYIYNDKYIAGATIRRDGSSRFGTQNRWGYFPAAQVAWRISKEDFLKESHVVNDLKMRVSYGITGNSGIGDYTAKSSFGLVGDYDGQTGLAVARLNIENYSWEENHTVNLGIDFGLFNNRISGAVDLFNADRKKLLLSKPLPITSGFTSVVQNVGVLNNKGVEVSLSTVNLQLHGFTWTTDIIYSYVKNKVKKLIEGQDKIGTAIVKGMPVNALFTYKYAGVNPADGRPFYWDSLGNLTYVPVARDRYYLDGTLDPTFQGGITNTFTYKGIELRIFFQFSGGNYLLNQDAIFASRSGSTIDRNQYQNQLRRWQKPGDITDVPKPYRGGTQPGAGSNYFLSDRFYEKGDYLRLKEVTLAYNFPRSLTSKLHIQNARFYLSGVNLYTWTNYLGYDPELLNGTTGDFGVYPQGRQTNVGIQVTF